MKRALWALPVVGALLLLFAFGFRSNPNVVPTPLVGGPAPSFALHRIDGGTLSIGTLRGRPVVLNFWATWCVACHQEHPLLVQAYRRWGKRVTFVGVVFEDSSSAARAYLHEHGGGWPNLADPNGTTAVAYGVSGVPESFFINARGVIVAKSTGPVTPALLLKDVPKIIGGRGA